MVLSAVSVMTKTAMMSAQVWLQGGRMRMVSVKDMEGVGLEAVPILREMETVDGTETVAVWGWEEVSVPWVAEMVAVRVVISD